MDLRKGASRGRRPSCCRPHQNGFDVRWRNGPIKILHRHCFRIGKLLVVMFANIQATKILALHSSGPEGCFSREAIAAAKANLRNHI
jgi:hypothetical protein